MGARAELAVGGEERRRRRRRARVASSEEEGSRESIFGFRLAGLWGGVSLGGGGVSAWKGWLFGTLY